MALSKYLSPLVILALLFALVGVIMSTPDSKRSAPVQVGRFQIVGAGSNAAFDTATGKMCWLYDPLGQGSEKIPLCSSLVK